MQQEKNSFIMGLSVGIAGVALIGFAVMSVAYFQKDGSKENVKEDSDQVVQEDNNPSAPTKADIKVTKDDHIRGNKEAKITIVSFSDYQCPFCSRFHETMNKVMENYSNDVRWVFKHFPLDSLHPYARKAAEAAECANDQDKFWEYTDAVFANQASLNQEYLSTVAKNVGLDTGDFEKCLSSGKYTNKVNEDYKLGIANGVQGTPASFINGQLVSGAVPYEQIEAAINSLK